MWSLYLSVCLYLTLAPEPLDRFISLDIGNCWAIPILIHAEP
jgi:hypothetical protein